VVARAMQKDIALRYASWEEFTHDLAQAFRNKQLKARERDFADTEKFETLRGLPFFAQFSDVEIWEVVRFSDWDQVTPDTVVLTPGDCFGEMAVIGQTSGSRNADVVAQTPAKIITIRGDALRQASEVCRMHFYAAFLEVLANRLALANARLASV
jgi:CRP-like cAMP-binding protein